MLYFLSCPLLETMTNSVCPFPEFESVRKCPSKESVQANKAIEIGVWLPSLTLWSCVQSLSVSLCLSPFHFFFLRPRLILRSSERWNKQTQKLFSLGDNGLPQKVLVLRYKVIDFHCQIKVGWGKRCVSHTLPHVRGLLPDSDEIFQFTFCRGKCSNLYDSQTLLGWLPSPGSEGSSFSQVLITSTAVSCLESVFSFLDSDLNAFLIWKENKKTYWPNWATREKKKITFLALRAILVCHFVKLGTDGRCLWAAGNSVLYSSQFWGFWKRAERRKGKWFGWGRMYANSVTKIALTLSTLVSSKAHY